MLPESSSRPLPCQTAQSRNLVLISLKIPVQKLLIAVMKSLLLEWLVIGALEQILPRKRSINSLISKTHDVMNMST